MAGKGNPKGVGRPKGCLNKTTTSVKAALEAAFEGMGGVTRLKEWAEGSPEEFYKLWAKLLPAKIEAGMDPENPFRHEVRVTFVRPPPRD